MSQIKRDYHDEMIRASDEAFEQLCRQDDERSWFEAGPEDDDWKRHRELLNELKGYTNVR